MALLSNLEPTDDFSAVETKLDQTIDSVNRITAGNTLQSKAIDIGPCDLQSSAFFSVAHGIASLDIAKVVEVRALIINDSLGTKTPFDGGGFITIDSTDIILQRNGGGQFDSSSYNDGVINRGTILITYKF